MQRDRVRVFDPWYAYLSTLETVFVAGLCAAMVATLWAGLVDPGTDLGASAGLALLFAGFIAFFVRWSVTEERAATLPGFEEEY